MKAEKACYQIPAKVRFLVFLEKDLETKSKNKCINHSTEILNSSPLWVGY